MSRLALDHRIAGLLVALLLALGIAAGPARVPADGHTVAQTHALHA